MDEHTSDAGPRLLDQPEVRALLADVWIPVGLPGYSGAAKGQRQAVLDARFGPDGWRFAHVVRGAIVPKSVAILEYEAAYRRYLIDRPALVEFLVSQCGNVYDDNIANVYDADYEQPHTDMNHYQDIAVRRVICGLIDDTAWPTVVDTAPQIADLIDLGSGETHRVPRARGFRGRYAMQIREPLSPGYCLNPAVVPVHDPLLITTLPGRIDWYHAEGCAHLSVEAFWQMSKVLEVRYDRFLALGPERSQPMLGL
jgi:hypothetical protein